MSDSEPNPLFDDLPSQRPQRERDVANLVELIEDPADSAAESLDAEIDDDHLEPFLDPLEWLRLEKRMISSAQWFYWIAILSVVNSVVNLMRQDELSLFGRTSSVFVNQVASGLARRHPDWFGIFQGVALGFACCAAGGFALIGRASIRRETWCYIIGIALYALDTILALVFQHYLMAVFHVIVLYLLNVGLQLCRRLNEADQLAASETD
jgi:hypothetical protein